MTTEETREEMETADVIEMMRAMCGFVAGQRERIKEGVTTALDEELEVWCATLKEECHNLYFTILCNR